MSENHAGWTDMFRDQAESGLSINEWCRRNRVTRAAFESRMHILRKHGIHVNPPRRKYGDREAVTGPMPAKAAPERKTWKDLPPLPVRLPRKESGQWVNLLRMMAAQKEVYLVQKVHKRLTPDRMRALIEYRYKMNPYSGSCFLFRARNARVVHMLMWDGDGFVHMVKRSEKYPFRWPRGANGVRVLTEEEVEWLFLMGGTEKAEQTVGS